jgi:DNA-binding IscR family transcriptional regulator
MGQKELGGLNIPLIPTNDSKLQRENARMAQSGRFRLSLRILAVLAAAPDTMRTSAEIAEELSESAVMVRRYFPLLEKSGLIEQRRGPGGGAKLKAAPQEIGVGDVYLAAESDWLAFGKSSISKLLNRARKDGVLAMNEITLAEVMKRMGKKSLSASRPPRKSEKLRVERVASLSVRGGDSETRVSRGDSSRAVGIARTRGPLIPTAAVHTALYGWQ